MLVKIGNHPREYDWGSKTLLADALNIEATRAQAQVRDADRWPTLNAGLTGSRQPLQFDLAEACQRRGLSS